MRESTPQERMAAVALVAGLLLVLAVKALAPAVSEVVRTAASSPAGLAVDLLPLAAGTLVVSGTLIALRKVAVARTLRSRVRVELLPSEAFDPSPEAVVRFASQLARVRRAVLGWLDRPASAVRVELASGPDGLMHYILEVPRRGLPALYSALGAYDQLEVREAAREPLKDGGVVGRAELVLARSSALPLAEVGLEPDPLQSFAAALGLLNVSRGERASVVLDVMPAAAHQRRRLRRRLLREADRLQSTSGMLAVPLGQRQARGRMGVSEAAGRRFEGRAVERKLGGGEPLFALQLLVQVRASSKPRVQSELRSLLACFDAFAGENHLRVAGLNLGGVAFAGSDLPWRRGRFDARIASGRFAPRRRRVVGAGEIAGLLKPATVNCAAENVARSGGVIPPPPVQLPQFSGQRDLIPLGRVQDRNGERMVGVRVSETFFAYQAGRSRYGKTETGIGQFVHLVRSGYGGMFLDPHADAIREIKTYLADMPERIMEIDLSDPDRQGEQLAWNLFWLERRTAGQAAARVEAFVDALAAALRWDDRNTRALNIATQSAQALLELAQRLPAKLAPTVFQVPTLLSNAEWREAALPHMSQGTASFFRDRFPRLAPDAATAVTNIIDRLRAARSVAALMGTPVSTYSAERAMRDGMIVLACPGSGSTRDRLVANLLVYDMLHAFKQRAHLKPEARRPFFLFLDELQTYDGPNLPVLLEQSAKYGGRGFLFNQNPDRLSDPTWNAVTTNRSHLSSTTVNARAAQMIAREWSGQIEPDVLTRLERFTYLSQVTLGKRTSKPFLVRGVTARELHGEHYTPPPETAAPEAQRRRGIDHTLKVVEGHDERIARWLQEHRPARRGECEEGRTHPSGGGRRVLKGSSQKVSKPR
ncbi:MAG: hypothetical protein WAU77_03315 [Solirubrobacteraceae bacterium]